MIGTIQTMPLWKKTVIALLIIGILWWGYRKYSQTASSATQYETSNAKKGTLVVSVSASGQVASTNSSNVTTEASGVVTAVYVKDGDTVKMGDTIGTIDLDLIGKQRTAQAYASYQSAQNNVNTAQANYFALQSDLFSAWQKYMEIAQSSSYENADHSPKQAERQLPDFMITQDDWRSAEEKYKNQEGVLNQAKQSLSSAWISYQQTSPTIVAPISGTIVGFSLQKGSVITPEQGGSTASNAQKIASIKTDAPPTISISLTEIDVPRITVGQKATVIFDAFSDKTFTGKVVSVDTIGSISSGVTSYPVVIQLDTQSKDILPNMKLTANIITNTKDNVLLVPSSAVKTSNGTTTVQVMKSGKPVDTPVQVGLSSDTDTEIVSGISEGDTVVTATVSNTSATTNTSTSPFSPFGGVRTNRRG